MKKIAIIGCGNTGRISETLDKLLKEFDDSEIVDLSSENINDIIEKDRVLVITDTYKRSLTYDVDYAKILNLQKQGSKYHK